MLGYFEAIEEQLRENAQMIRLPATTAEQLELSMYWTPVY